MACQPRGPVLLGSAADNENPPLCSALLSNRRQNTLSEGVCCYSVQYRHFVEVARFAQDLLENSASPQVRPYVTQGDVVANSLTERVETVQRLSRDQSVTKPVPLCPHLFPIQSGMSDSKITMFAVRRVEAGREGGYPHRSTHSRHQGRNGHPHTRSVGTRAHHMRARRVHIRGVRDRCGRAGADRSKRGDRYCHPHIQPCTPTFSAKLPHSPSNLHRIGHSAWGSKVEHVQLIRMHTHAWACARVCTGALI